MATPTPAVKEITCIPGKEVIQTEEYDPHMVENFTAIALPRDIPTWEITLKILFYSIAFLIDTIGNSIVVLIIVINKRMRSKTTVLILNLAISDLMVGCFCMWVHAGNSVTKEWPFGLYVCKVNTFMQVLAVTSSVLTLTSISVERFYAIVFPLKRCVSPRITVIAITLSWIIATAIALPQLVVRRQFEYYWKDRHQVWCDEEWPKVYIDTDCHYKMPGRTTYYVVVCIVLYFIPIFVMLCAYIFIVFTMVFRKGPGSFITTSRQAQNRSKKKVIRMLMLVLMAFIICWTPQQAFILWDIFRSREKTTESYVLNIKYVAVYTAYLNSALNPILYGGFNENFRSGFKDAFKCLLLKKRNAVAPIAPTQRTKSAIHDVSSNF